MQGLVFNPAHRDYGAHYTRPGAYNAEAIQACFQDFLSHMEEYGKYSPATFEGPGGPLPIGVPSGQKAAISLTGGWAGWHLKIDWGNTVLIPDESCGGAALWDALDLRGAQGSYPEINSFHPGIETDPSLIPGAMWLIGRAAHGVATGDHALAPLIGKGFAKFGFLNNAAEMTNAPMSRIYLCNDDGLPFCNDGANRHFDEIMDMSDSVRRDPVTDDPLLTKGQGESFEGNDFSRSTFMKVRWDWTAGKITGLGSGPAAWVTRWSGHNYSGAYFGSRDHAPLVLKVDANGGENIDLSRTHYEGSRVSDPADPSDYAIPHCVKIEGYTPTPTISGIKFSTGNVHASSGSLFDISTLTSLTLADKEISNASGAKTWSHPGKVKTESRADPGRNRLTIDKDSVHVLNVGYRAARIEIVTRNLNGTGGGWLKLMASPASQKFHGGPNFKMTTGPLTASSGNPGEVLVSAAGDGEVHICNRLDTLEFGIEIMAAAEPV